MYKILPGGNSVEISKRLLGWIPATEAPWQRVAFEGKQQLQERDGSRESAQSGSVEKHPRVDRPLLRSRSSREGWLGDGWLESIQPRKL